MKSTSKASTATDESASESTATLLAPAPSAPTFAKIRPAWRPPLAYTLNRPQSKQLKILSEMLQMPAGEILGNLIDNAIYHANEVLISTRRNVFEPENL